MKILYILPRNMYFGTSRATSIDLCCKDIITCSTYRSTTAILSTSVEDPFEGFDIVHLPRNMGRSTRTRMNYAVDLIRKSRPDIVVVQQHVPSAKVIARKAYGIPVILHRHAFPKTCNSNTMFGRFRRMRTRWLYERLAGIIHVSQVCDAQFAADWPEIAIPRAVVPNGLPFSQWRPNSEREQEILYVGRCAPEKGVLEAAQAIGALLPEWPGWRARFILSETEKHRDYYAKVLAALAPAGPQVVVELQRPHNEVKRANERAAIAIVPSLCQEAFGRSALEAHAGGAALISSCRLGLREVSGDNALFLEAVTPAAIRDACLRLMRDTQVRENLAQAGHHYVKDRFAIEMISRHADAFYGQIVRQHATKQWHSA
jgi:glycosyltransferase involved in cell wall biosynthesis